MTNRVLLALALTAASAGLSSASTINCAGVADVTTLNSGNGNTCNVTGASNILFGNFEVSFTGGASGPVGISSNAALTNVTGNDVNLGLQFPSPSNGQGDILLFYAVTGGISGIDIEVQAAPTVAGGSITVIETACAVQFVSGTCSSVLANLTGSTSGTDVLSLSQSFAPTQTVYIKKDMGFINANASLVVNSQLLPIPEPFTLSMLGIGLLGLGLIPRKLRK